MKLGVWVSSLLLLCTIGSCGSTEKQIAEETTFTNPLIYADVPDVDVIRVGSDYFMVSTTAHMSPGAPIMHSKDMVNWEIISYVFDELNESPKIIWKEETFIAADNGPLPYVIMTAYSMFSLEQEINLMFTPPKIPLVNGKRN